MKAAALIVVTLAVVVSSAEGNLFRWFYSLDPLVEDDAPECQGKAQSCIDCYTVRTCAKLPNYKPVANTTCPNNAPYCSDGQCVADLPAGSDCADGDTTSSTFKCNGDGYFPDPTDCTKYHFCVNDKATDYDCKMYPFTVYDQKSGQCKPKNEAQCYTFKCPANQVLKYQWYGPDNSIYGYCISRDESQIQLSKCPENKRLNITDTVDPQCVPYCAQQGRFAHDSDTTKYYECGGKPGRLVGPILRGCPSGSQYDTEKQQCVIQSSDDTESSTSAPGSSSTTQASDGSSSTTQASDGSSSTTQASGGSDSDSPSTVSSSTTQASSSTDSSSDSSSTESSSTVSSSSTQASDGSDSSSTEASTTVSSSSTEASSTTEGGSLSSSTEASSSPSSSSTQASDGLDSSSTEASSTVSSSSTEPGSSTEGGSSI